ncbi:TIGR02680 family protein [Cryobacterium melibiosiphilum]|uniref:TIGR02680 family protein n=1 Tax=Cryobacterium melibiosiphilum TaxID=995039 RepID=A0A3A5MP91_9MICO|nr:TIGR02680 family protein [Cryobacterium melibiosiphilum]RJT91907.1 TIGR02680 family protein [Cryobacterium melibiosiphilum]
MNNAIVTDLSATARASDVKVRFRLVRAGIVNVHKFANVEFPCAGGRVVFRGPNGSGKSRGMDMLFPFLLTGDRRRMGSGSSGAVTVDSLMRVMLGKDSNRVGYVWAEYRNGDGDHRTVGAYFKYSRNTSASDVHFFITELRVGHGLQLMDDTRHPLSRAQLGELVGPHNITQQGTEHGSRVAQELFGVTDDAGRARLAAAFGVMYNLRSPDFGAKYRAKDVTRLLTESLPLMPDDTIRSAGLSLDNLQDTRDQQHNIEAASRHASETLLVYRGYVTTVLNTETEGLTKAVTSAEAAATAEESARDQEIAAQARLRQKDKEAFDLREQIIELTADKAALEKSPAYKGALAFVDRRAMVDALKGSAVSELSSWWLLSDAVDAAVKRAMADSETVAGTGDNLSQAVRAAGMCAVDAGLEHTFPVLSVSVAPGASRLVNVRRSVEAEPVIEIHDGTPSVIVNPVDLVTVTDKFAALRIAAISKQGVAEARLETAERLMNDERSVRLVEQGSQKAERDAHAGRAAAVAAAEQADAARLVLGVAWAGWAQGPATSTLFGEVDWTTTTLSGLLADGILPPVHELDGVAESVAADAVAHVAVTAQQVRDRRTAFIDERELLTEEQDKLIGNETPAPERSSWVSVADGPAFWETVDFRPGVPERIQDAVESALRASGILAATVTKDGVEPVTGELIVSSRGSVAARSLIEILSADKAGSEVAEILGRIGFNDPTCPVNIHEDGSWHAGPLGGRSPITPAQHIGAAARERTRRARLEQIDIRLSDISTLLIANEEDQAAATALRTSIRAQIAAAPTSTAVIQADTASSIAGTTAKVLQLAAGTASDEALQARTEWDAREAIHRRACHHAGLPETEPKLQERVQQLRTTVSTCDEATIFAETFARQRRTFQTTSDDVSGAVTAADTQILLTDKSGERWRSEAAIVRKLEATVGVSAEQVMTELADAESALRTAGTLKDKTDSQARDAASKHGAAVTTVDNATNRAVALADDAVEVAEHVHAILRLPGVTDTVEAIERPAEATPAELVRWLRSNVINTKQRPVSVDDVHVAVDTLRDHVTQMFGVHRTTTDGVLLVELIGGEGTHPLPTAAADLATRAETGRQAIMQSEADVFSRFIVDGVATDMRKVIRLATETIRDTSARVSAHRTSNGIGVRLKFADKDDVPEAVNRIRELVAIADQVRSTAENAELSTLLRQTVQEAYDLNRAEGYGRALADSLDYRNWYSVEPVVLGPNDSQERTLKSAKLSEGELRYVTYLALISALDSHLSALPPIAPRLILLDDAYAMVDDHGRRILTSILVERDIDFMMTGFDLWLHYANINSLDEYEIRSTGEETPTTAVRYHWDGQRHNLREV